MLSTTQKAKAWDGLKAATKDIRDSMQVSDLARQMARDMLAIIHEIEDGLDANPRDGKGEKG